MAKERVRESLAEKAVRIASENYTLGKDASITISRGKKPIMKLTMRSSSEMVHSAEETKQAHYELTLCESSNRYLTFEELCKLRDELIRITKRR